MCVKVTNFSFTEFCLYLLFLFKLYKVSASVSAVKKLSTVWNKKKKAFTKITLIKIKLGSNYRHLHNMVLWPDKNVDFLKWQPCHFPVMAICFVYVSLPTVWLLYFNNLTSCLVPNIILQLSFYCGWPSFGFKQFWMVELVMKTD